MKSFRFIVIGLVVLIVAAGVQVGYFLYWSAQYRCNDVEFIGLRGSGEAAASPGSVGSDSLGSTRTVFSTLAASLSGNIHSFGLDYPAVAIDSAPESLATQWRVAGLAEYRASVAVGEEMLRHRLAVRRDWCGSRTRFVLAGFSQGAQVIGDVLASDGLLGGAIVGVVLLGDPEYGGGGYLSNIDADPGRSGIFGNRAFPQEVADHVASFCRPHDPICSIGDVENSYEFTDRQWVTRGLAPHLEYGTSGLSALAGWTLKAWISREAPPKSLIRYVKVQAMCPVPGPPLSAPKVTDLGVASGAARVYWESVPGADWYGVYRVSGKLIERFRPAVSEREVSWAVAGLLHGRPYSFLVTAGKCSEESVGSRSKIATVP
ncbi:cutinase family protein [Actinomycetospora chiangmaiensis]|uniref:cutinase family protein n=1 Tax=Actinomycetospora chiangmaiensis TaxID=402650 RepID=UPI0009FD5ADD